MPETGLPRLGRYRLPTFEELARIGRVLVEEGIQKIRLTGGEPLLRNSLHGLIRDLSHIDNLQELCLTTNGHLLAERVQALADAGLHRVNVSVDSLDPQKFERITRGGDLRRVLYGVEKAAQVLPGVVRINVVVFRHFNDDELLDFARMTLDREYHVRFIEPMPISVGTLWREEDMIRADEMKQRVSDTFGLEKVKSIPLYSGPSSLYRIPGATGRVGFIGPMTDAFCAQCNRIRLTPDGKLRGCLLEDGEVDFLGPMRRGATDDDLRELIQQVVRNKPERHTIHDFHFTRPLRAMSQTGG